MRHARILGRGRGTFDICRSDKLSMQAPEVIQGEGHNQAADWWSLGILIYELLAGHPPFYDPNPMRIYDQVLSGTLRFPAEFGPITRSLLVGLLTLSKARRLGNLAGGANDVMQHEFFKHVNWDAVRRKEICAPWKPQVAHCGDTKMFAMWQHQHGDPMDVDEYEKGANLRGASLTFSDLHVQIFGARSTNGTTTSCRCGCSAIRRSPWIRNAGRFGRRL